MHEVLHSMKGQETRVFARSHVRSDVCSALASIGEDVSDTGGDEPARF